jgi:GLPGLI family protein
MMNAMIWRWYYKNVKEKTIPLIKILWGKSFLVKDSLPSLKWKMEAKRVIGGYTCYKLPLLRKASADFRNFRPKRRSKKGVLKRR